MYVLKKTPHDFIVTERARHALKERGLYSVWYLTKTGMNTSEAVKRIAEFLNAPMKNVGYAGSKDKHAITEQYISIKCPRERIKNFDHPKMSIEYLGRQDNPITLGDLEGNSFEITIRNIDSPPHTISQMVNYFGEQRFGSVNWKVGHRILKGDLKEACDLMAEKSVREHLEKHPKDYVEALKKIPRRVLLIYIHSYQSCIWNKVVAEYIKENCRDVAKQEWDYGTLVYPVSRLDSLDAPLVGFGTQFTNDFIKNRTLELLEEDGLTQRSFINRKLPFLSVEGSIRSMIVPIEELSIGELEKDELHERQKKCTMKFFLPKGSYATMAIRQMMRKG